MVEAKKLKDAMISLGVCNTNVDADNLLTDVGMDPYSPITFDRMKLIITHASTHRYDALDDENGTGSGTRSSGGAAAAVAGTVPPTLPLPPATTRSTKSGGPVSSRGGDATAGAATGAASTGDGKSKAQNGSQSASESSGVQLKRLLQKPRAGSDAASDSDLQMSTVVLSQRRVRALRLCAPCCVRACSCGRQRRRRGVDGVDGCVVAGACVRCGCDRQCVAADEDHTRLDQCRHARRGALV